MVAYRNGGMRMWHVESVAVAREYACSENGRKREAAAGSTLTPAAYLGRLVYDRLSYVRKAALRNPKTPVCDLVAYASAVIAGEVGGALSDVAAGNPALPSWFVGDAVTCAVQEAEREGRKSVPFSVYRLIEESPNLSEAVMVWLVEGRRPGYERVVANLSASARVFRLLATVEDWSVRCDVANRVGVPPGVLAVLAYDEEERVRETAFSRKEMPEYVYDDVIVRDLDKADRVYEAVDASKSVTAHMLSVMRLAPPYASKEEGHAFEGLYVKSGKWLEERGIELE